jgi:hypothetical protein
MGIYSIHIFIDNENIVMAKGACFRMFDLSIIDRLEEIREALFTVITTLGRGYLILKEKREVFIRAFTFCI